MFHSRYFQIPICMSDNGIYEQLTRSLNRLLIIYLDLSTTNIIHVVQKECYKGNKIKRNIKTGMKQYYHS